MSEIHDELLSFREAAEEYGGLSERWLRECARRRLLKTVPASFGKGRRVKRRNLEGFLALRGLIDPPPYADHCPPCVSLTAASERLGVPRSALYRAAAAGRIPAARTMLDLRTPARWVIQVDGNEDVIMAETSRASRRERRRTWWRQRRVQNVKLKALNEGWTREKLDAEVEKVKAICDAAADAADARDDLRDSA